MTVKFLEHQKRCKKMKRAFVILLLTVAIFCNGCATTTKQQSQGSVSNVNNLVVKDYEVKGIIYLTSTAIERTDTKGNIEIISGSHITYEALMKKAQELGADDIMNLRIDKKTEPSKSNGNRGVGNNKEAVYTATALAVKYTKAVPVSVTIADNGTYISNTQNIK
jgi:hypothetical protein